MSFKTDYYKKKKKQKLKGSLKKFLHSTDLWQDFSKKASKMFIPGLFFFNFLEPQSNTLYISI